MGSGHNQGLATPPPPDMGGHQLHDIRLQLERQSPGVTDIWGMQYGNEELSITF